MKRKNLKRYHNNNNRSDEIEDIVDRMPMNFGYWVVVAVVCFFILVLIFGWIIKYPDSITGRIKINSTLSPVKLVTNTSGKIQLFDYKAQDSVKENDCIAVIQNPANTNDVLLISSLLENLDITHQEIYSEMNSLFPDKMSLGELNLKYYTFLSLFKHYCNYLQENNYAQQRLTILEDIKWKETLQKETETEIATIEEKLKIAKKWFDKYESLNKDIVTTHEYEVDHSKNEYLSVKQNEQNLKKSLTNIQMQIAESRNRLQQLNIEKNEKERQMQVELFSAYYDLSDNIKAWQEKYLFKAPFDGKVEFLNFWTNNQFIQVGEAVFSIIPKENIIIGQMLLPSNGAGKVSVGSRVTIKLDNFPYQEFGSIDGYVNSISLTTNTYETGQNTINTYLITVDLPMGLKTNYGEALDFKYELEGNADIIVKERRLIERLFDNLKARTK